MSTDPIFTEEELEAARVLFAHPCTFMMGAVKMDGLPAPDLPEVAFAGRSNVGKSSLINALVGQNHLARASNEPGRTREVNFFVLDEQIRLVDLPRLASHRRRAGEGPEATDAEPAVVDEAPARRVAGVDLSELDS